MVGTAHKGAAFAHPTDFLIQPGHPALGAMPQSAYGRAGAVAEERQ